MKKFKFTGVFFLFLCVFTSQMVFSAIVIKKDDPGTGTTSVMSRARASSLSISSSFIPVTADVVGDELIVDFSSNVGTAYVSVVDQSGNVVSQTVVDTFSSSEVVIPVDGLSSGKYSLKISYGTTKLTGDFQL